jgi:hypothetical protein
MVTLMGVGPGDVTDRAGAVPLPGPAGSAGRADIEILAGRLERWRRDQTEPIWMRI